LFLLVAGGLMACGGKDTREVPAELIEFDPTLSVRTVWKHRVGNGTERLRLGLAPATDATRIFAGAYDGTAAAIDLVSGDVLWEVETDFNLAA
jgi:outer membrane protein assembly factor BamB